MNRFALAALPVLLAVLVAPAVAPAQTMPDYERWLAEIPLGTNPAVTADRCLPVANYVETSMARWQQKLPELLTWLPLGFAVDADLAQRRQACDRTFHAAVMDFEPAGAEPLVVEPALSPPDALSRGSEPVR
jgi:hypothetical protein